MFEWIKKIFQKKKESYPTIRIYKALEPVIVNYSEDANVSRVLLSKEIQLRGSVLVIIDEFRTKAEAKALFDGYKKTSQEG